MTPFNTALGNVDIWTEVLQYFHIFPDLDSGVEIADKRRALLRVALLSPSLTNIALDTLWATMTSLEPIVHVINSKVTFPDDELLSFQEDDSYWVLRRPIAAEGDCDRTFEYLSRVRHFQVAMGYTREMGLWSTLSMSLGLSPSSSLLPRLRSLSLDFTQAGNVGSWIITIYPLLSPTLTAISYNAPRFEHAAGIDTLQTMLRSQSLALTHVTYQGHPSAFLLQTCLAFDGLETLKLTCELDGGFVQQHSSGVTIAEVFEKLRYLKDLEIDVRVFPLGNSTTGPPQREITSPLFLQKLSITGDAADIGQFLLDGIKSSSLLSLAVAILESNNLVWKVICDRITSNFPKLHSLSLKRVGMTGIHQVLLQDISALISRSQMQSFQLNGIPHCFTEANMSGLLDSWPKLHTLAITNDYTIHFSASLLIKISQANHLRHVKLPFNLESFHTMLPNDSMPISHSPIQELTLTSVSSIPPSLETKICLARNLSVLFPKLNRVYTEIPLYQADLDEVETLIRSFRDAIITYLRRRDSEKRLASGVKPEFGVQL